MNIVKRIFVVAALAAFASVSFGQGFRGGFGGGMQSGAMLLGRDDVKNDLKLTDDQKTKLLDLQDSLKSKFGDAFRNAGSDQAARTAAMKVIMDDANKQVNAILTPDQQVRVKQIGYQLAGNSAASVPEVATDLKLTDDQKTKIAALQKTEQEANQAVFQKVRSQEIDFPTAIETSRKNQEALNTEIGKILTDDQKAELKKLGGPTFTPDPPPGG